MLKKEKEKEKDLTLKRTVAGFLLMFSIMIFGSIAQAEGVVFFGFEDVVPLDNICVGQDVIGTYIQVKSVNTYISESESQVFLECSLITAQEKPNEELLSACGNIDRKYWNYPISKEYLDGSDFDQVEELSSCL